jgi:Tfp pilus assembly protein PilN
MELVTIIEKYWTVIVTFIGVVVSYTTLRNQNTEQEKRICHLEAKMESVDTIQAEIKVALAEIQLDLKWIKQSLNR